MLIPFAILVALSVKQWHHNPFLPLVPPGKPVFQVFGVGLALGLWLYSGYEQLSTVAEEVRDPQRTYPRALAWVVPLSIATYFIPTAFSLAALNNWQDWKTGYFSEAARLIGGHWLGIAMTIGAAAMQISILNSTVLASTRVPFAMAEDGYMTPWLSRLHPRFGTPYAAILLSCAIYALLAQRSLTAAHLDLHLAAYSGLSVDGSLRVAPAALPARTERRIPDSGRERGFDLRGYRAHPDECIRHDRERSVCLALGTGSAAVGTRGMVVPET